MANIKIVDEFMSSVFEDECNKLLNEGYKLLSSSCGFIDNERYDYCSVYKAIFIKE
jgi:hypothetical protein